MSMAVARADLVTGVGVVVDDSVITYAEIEDVVAQRAETVERVYANDPARYEQELQKLHDQEVEEMIEDKLIVHEFTASGYTTNVLEAFIDDQIRDRIQKEYYGDRSRLIKTLQAQGMTYEMFRRQEREKFIIRYMKFQNGSNERKIIISPLKIETYYAEHKNEFKVDDQVHLRMITIPQQQETSPGTARKMGEESLAKIVSGVPFTDMAGVYSSGAQRAEGGDRGWVDRTYFKPELATVAFSLKPGQHSGVIELPEGCYLLMVEDVRTAHVRPLDEVRGDIEHSLKTEEGAQLYRAWIERLKRKSFVQYY